MARRSKTPVETRFKIWMSSIQRQVREATGLTAAELPELDYREGFASGEAPERYFDWVVKFELERMGFALELHGLLDPAACDNLMAAEPDEAYGEDLE